MKLTLTKSTVDSLPHPDDGKSFYYDTKLIGFGLYCTKTSKTYFAEGRVGGKTVRVSIGKHGVFTPETARNKARELLVQMAGGDNPNRKTKSVTLKEAVSSYLKERTSGTGKRIRQTTKDGYQWLLDSPLKPYWDVSFLDIDDRWVKTTYRKLTNEHGPACATNSFRMLRAVYNFNQIHPNPIAYLSTKRLWNPDKRRTRFIREDDVSEWIRRVDRMNPNMRGAILTMLFLGLRRNEVLTLKKSQIIDKCIVFDIGETKNGDEHLVPIGPFLWERIEPLLAQDGKYLFKSRDSKSGHLVDTRKALATLNVKVSNHDLRRTFVTHLNSLEPAPSQYTIKRLMNHRQSSDVTAGYIQHERKKLIDVITRLEKAMVG